MALDNAEFISELSIVDPPGTDPLNQGDDHIRTTKKAVQQSFPNVGSAVPQTGVQMAQMAIKNEENTFTQVNFFQSRVELQDTNFRFELAGSARGIQYRVAAGLRWAINVNPTTVTLNFNRHSAGGALLDVPISIDNTTGIVSFVQRATFLSGLKSNASIQIDTVDATRTFNWQESGVNLWQLQVLNIGLDRQFRLRRNDVAGAQVDIPFSVSFTDGIITTTNRFDNTTNIRIVTDDNASRGYQWQSQDGVNREWDLVFNGVSKDLNLRRFSGGVQQENPISIAQANGFVTFVNTTIFKALSASAVARNEYRDSTDLIRWRWDKLAETGNANLRLQAFDSTGTFTFTPMTFKRATQTININIPSSNAGLASGDLFISSGFVAIVP